MNAELHFSGLDIALFNMDVVYKKDYHRYKGTPILFNQGGLLYFEFPYGEVYERLL